MDFTTSSGNGTRDAYLYDLKDDSITRIADLSRNLHTWEQLKPGINGNWVVWFDGEKNIGSSGSGFLFYNNLTLIILIVVICAIFKRSSKATK